MPAERRDFAVTHELQQVQLFIQVGSQLTPPIVRATGRTSTKRRDLWLVEHQPVVRDVFSSADWIHTLALSVLCDRPRNQDALDRSLRGGVDWEDTPLPF